MDSLRSVYVSIVLCLLVPLTTLLDWLNADITRQQIYRSVVKPPYCHYVSCLFHFVVKGASTSLFSARFHFAVHNLANDWVVQSQHNACHAPVVSLLAAHL